MNIDSRTYNLAGRMADSAFPDDKASKEDARQEGLIKFWYAYESRPDLPEDDRRRYSNAAMRNGVERYRQSQGATGSVPKKGKATDPLRQPHSVVWGDAPNGEDEFATQWDGLNVHSPDIARQVTNVVDLTRAMQTLPERAQKVVWLFLAGWQHEEIGQEIGLSARQTRKIYRLALTELKDVLS